MEINVIFHFDRADDFIVHSIWYSSMCNCAHTHTPTYMEFKMRLGLDFSIGDHYSLPEQCLIDIWCQPNVTFSLITVTFLSVTFDYASSKAQFAWVDFNFQPTSSTGAKYRWQKQTNNNKIYYRNLHCHCAFPMWILLNNYNLNNVTDTDMRTSAAQKNVGRYKWINKYSNKHIAIGPDNDFIHFFYFYYFRTLTHSNIEYKLIAFVWIEFSTCMMWRRGQRSVNINWIFIVLKMEFGAIN